MLDPSLARTLVLAEKSKTDRTLFPIVRTWAAAMLHPYTKKAAQVQESKKTQERAQRAVLLHGGMREAAVFATVVEKGLAFFQFEAFDFGDEDGVIAGHVLGNDIACKMRESVIEKWNARRSPLEANAETGLFGKVLQGLGKMFGDLRLCILQDVHTETALCLDVRQKAGVLVDTDKDQQRIQGNRSERVRGHAVNLPRFAFGSEHRNTGGKAAHHMAK